MRAGAMKKRGARGVIRWNAALEKTELAMVQALPVD
jgi:hypothetical protein